MKTKSLLVGVVFVSCCRIICSAEGGEEGGEKLKSCLRGARPVARIKRVVTFDSHKNVLRLPYDDGDDEARRSIEVDKVSTPTQAELSERDQDHVKYAWEALGWQARSAQSALGDPTCYNQLGGLCYLITPSSILSSYIQLHAFLKKIVNRQVRDEVLTLISVYISFIALDPSSSAQDRAKLHKFRKNLILEFVNQKDSNLQEKRSKKVKRKLPISAEPDVVVGVRRRCLRACAGQFD